MPRLAWWAITGAAFLASFIIAATTSRFLLAVLPVAPLGRGPVPWLLVLATIGDAIPLRRGGPSASRHALATLTAPGRGHADGRFRARSSRCASRPGPLLHARLNPRTRLGATNWHGMLSVTGPAVVRKPRVCDTLRPSPPGRRPLPAGLRPGKTSPRASRPDDPAAVAVFQAVIVKARSRSGS